MAYGDRTPNYSPLHDGTAIDSFILALAEFLSPHSDSIELDVSGLRGIPHRWGSKRPHIQGNEATTPGFKSSWRKGYAVKISTTNDPFGVRASVESRTSLYDQEMPSESWFEFVVGPATMLAKDALHALLEPIDASYNVSCNPYGGIWIKLSLPITAWDLVCHNRAILRSFVAHRDREFAGLLDNALRGWNCSKINKLYQDRRYRNRLFRRVENRLRVLHGVPRIGEGYIAESTLYSLVKKRFPNAKREHSPKWIGKRRLDIYIPELRTAIEYHGEQHYEPLEFFGGTEALALRQERDRQKDEVCQREGVRLVVWPYTRPVNEEEFSYLINEICPSAERSFRQLR